MVTTTQPKYDTSQSETGCCPRFDPMPWDGEEFEFKDKLFLRSTTINFMHIPLNMGSMMRKTWKKIEDAQAATLDEFLVLSTDPSPWRGDHYFAVNKDLFG